MGKLRIGTLIHLLTTFFTFIQMGCGSIEQRVEGRTYDAH